MPGFPLHAAAPLVYAPVGADLDGDGLLELAALGRERLYLWEPGNFSPPYSGGRVGWGQAGYDASGIRAHPAVHREAVPPDLSPVLLPEERAYCYPNPVEGEGAAHLRFFLGRPARVRLEVFDAIGRRVEKRKAEMVRAAPSEHEISWPVSRYASGLYICRLEAVDEEGGKEVIFVRMAVSR